MTKSAQSLFVLFLSMVCLTMVLTAPGNGISQAVTGNGGSDNLITGDPRELLTLPVVISQTVLKGAVRGLVEELLS